MPTTIDTSIVPECFTRFPASRHDEEAQIALASAGAENSFHPSVKDSRTHGEGPYGVMYALAFPQGDVERVKIAAEVIALLWVYDDVIEALPYHQAAQEHVSTAQLISSEENGDSAAAMPKRLRDVMAQAASLDPEGAVLLLRDIHQYLSEHDHEDPTFDTLQEYVPLRTLNFGYRVMDACMRWSRGIVLTAEEQRTCIVFYASAARVMALTNDYFSWELEKRRPADRAYNAVNIVMKQHTAMSELDAKLFLKGVIVDAEQMTVRLAETLKRSESGNVRRYVQGVEDMLGGTGLWGATSPRYNSVNV
ncbi:isoprenoid synthase domain-containing protein [Mycena maculata]|uniref:Isoprenoid synthase domain-containing protein n=1 Tax=Mycena maculata TaxID=230809 RepID=A0AAD7J8M1_9AGAR|nr:isoprenoid synthase domain-containing protein [Mycena maculata]